MLLKPFVVNRYGRMVFPCNFFPELNFSVFETLNQFNSVIRRDFGEKAPSEADIVARVKAGEYKNRYEICRDLALNLFWSQRYVLTMYEKRPTRWGDLPRHRNDIFLGSYTPRDSVRPTAAIEAGYLSLPPAWDEETEDKSFRILLDVSRNKVGSGGEFRALRPTVQEILADPKNLTYRLLNYEPDYPGYDHDDVIDCVHSVPELEALMRQSMILHNQYRWNPSSSTTVEVGKLHDDDYVVAFHPRNSEVTDFLRRIKQNARPEHHAGNGKPPSMPLTLALSEPEKPYPPVIVRDTFKVLPRVEAIAVYEGERLCTNKDLISNHAYCWSRMSEEDISGKTGIESRCVQRVESGGDVASGNARGLDQVGPEALRNRSRALLQLHQHPAHSVGCDVVVGRVGACARPTIPATSSPPARACRTACRKRYGCCRRSSARSSSYARKSSPTRSEPYAPPA